MARILVTGGAGFIGSALVRHLIKLGHQVRVLDDGSRGNPRRLADVATEVELIAGDVRDPDAVAKATAGVDAVAHLAFVNGTEYFYSHPELVLEVAVKGILHTLDAAIANEVPDFYLMSSSEVYQEPQSVPTDERVGMSIPDPLNPRYSYAGGKLISELMAINYGRSHFKRTVIVRPHNVYGPDMGNEHVIPQMALRMRELMAKHPTGTIPFPIQGDGTQTRAFVHIDDFTDGCARAFLSGGHLDIYHVGTEEEITIGDLAREVARACGREIEIVPGPAPAGGTPRRCPSIGKVRALGYSPRISLREGVTTTVEWYLRSAERT